MSAAVEPKKNETSLNQLDQLKKFTKVVADTGDFESMREYKPHDATTNPSLILQAATKPEYAHILDQVITDRKGSGLTGYAQIEDVMDNVLVGFGLEILKIVPGRVSTETDARLSFDTEGEARVGFRRDAAWDDLENFEAEADEHIVHHVLDLRVAGEAAAFAIGDDLIEDVRVFRLGRGLKNEARVGGRVVRLVLAHRLEIAGVGDDL